MAKANLKTVASNVQVSLKLARLPKKSGGVRYEEETTGEPKLGTIYVPQDTLREIGGGEFPQHITITVSA
jgi:hypothetical protein